MWSFDTSIGKELARDVTRRQNWESKTDRHPIDSIDILDGFYPNGDGKLLKKSVLSEIRRKITLQRKHLNEMESGDFTAEKWDSENEKLDDLIKKQYNNALKSLCEQNYLKLKRLDTFRPGRPFHPPDEAIFEFSENEERAKEFLEKASEMQHIEEEMKQQFENSLEFENFALKLDQLTRVPFDEMMEFYERKCEISDDSLLAKLANFSLPLHCLSDFWNQYYMGMAQEGMIQLLFLQQEMRKETFEITDEKRGEMKKLYTMFNCVLRRTSDVRALISARDILINWNSDPKMDFSESKDPFYTETEPELSWEEKDALKIAIFDRITKRISGSEDLKIGLMTPDQCRTLSVEEKIIVILVRGNFKEGFDFDLITIRQLNDFEKKLDRYEFKSRKDWEIIMEEYASNQPEKENLIQKSKEFREEHLYKDQFIIQLIGCLLIKNRWNFEWIPDRKRFDVEFDALNGNWNLCYQFLMDYGQKSHSEMYDVASKWISEWIEIMEEDESLDSYESRMKEKIEMETYERSIEFAVKNIENKVELMDQLAGFQKEEKEEEKTEQSQIQSEIQLPVHKFTRKYRNPKLEFLEEFKEIDDVIMENIFFLVEICQQNPQKFAEMINFERKNDEFDQFLYSAEYWKNRREKISDFHIRIINSINQ